MSLCRPPLLEFTELFWRAIPRWRGFQRSHHDLEYASCGQAGISILGPLPVTVLEVTWVAWDMLACTPHLQKALGKCGESAIDAGSAVAGASADWRECSPVYF
eukprot:365763-Chlamydomonas_euryale.AAC.10